MGKFIFAFYELHFTNVTIYCVAGKSLLSYCPISSEYPAQE